MTIELRWITRVIVGSNVDPDDETSIQVLQCRQQGGEWLDVPHATQSERICAYTGELLRKAGE